MDEFEDKIRLIYAETIGIHENDIDFDLYFKDSLIDDDGVLFWEAIENIESELSIKIPTNLVIEIDDFDGLVNIIKNLIEE